MILSIDRAIYILHRDRPIDDARNKARGMGCFTYCKMRCTKSSYARSAGRASARPWPPAASRVQPRDGARTPARPILFSTMFKTPPASPNDKVLLQAMCSRTQPFQGAPGGHQMNMPRQCPITITRITLVRGVKSRVAEKLEDLSLALRKWM